MNLGQTGACSRATNARQPPKFEMSRAPSVASASTKKPFTVRPSASLQRADRQRRRDGGDESAEGLCRHTPDFDLDGRSRAAAHAEQARLRRLRAAKGIEPVVGRGCCRFEQTGRRALCNSPLSGMPDRCAPTTAIAISSVGQR